MSTLPPRTGCSCCRCVASGAKIILSKLPVGDLATQFFADRNLFCAGRVAQDDMERVAKVRNRRHFAAAGGVVCCRRWREGVGEFIYVFGFSRPRSLEVLYAW